MNHDHNPLELTHALRALRNNLDEVRALATITPATRVYLERLLRAEEERLQALHQPSPRPITKLVSVNDEGRLVGQSHPGAKLTDAEVERLLELHESGTSQRELAGVFGISRTQVARLARGQHRSQLVTRTVRRPIRYDEPECFPASWHEFQDVSPSPLRTP